MRKVNLIQKGIFAILIMFAVLSCTKDDASSDGRLAITAKSAKTATKLAIANTDITDFLINLKEFKIEIDSEHEDDATEDWDDDGSYDYEDELKLNGPFELDLLSGQITFVSVDVPNGQYEEIKFKFGKSKDTNSQLFGKSILVKGTIDTVPFMLWLDFEDEMEVDFKDTQNDIVVQNSGDEVVINFDLSSILSAIDLSLAKDMNNDGLIEISPIDTDGNNNLAEQFKRLLKKHVELDDDRNRQ